MGSVKTPSERYSTDVRTKRNLRLTIPYQEAPRIILDLDARCLRRDTKVDGKCMAWRCWGSGPALVLLHGGSGAWTHWARNIEHLSSTYALFVPDLPGFGESDLPNAAPDPLSFVQFVLAHCRRQFKDQPFHLAGFSFGSIVAGLIASALGSQLLSLMLVGAVGLGLPLPAPIKLKRRSQAMAPDELLEIERFNLQSLMLHESGSIDDLAVYIQKMGSSLTRIKSINFFPEDSLFRSLTAISRHVSAVWGQFDATAHPNLETRIARLNALRNSVRANVINGAGHWVQYERPREFNEIALRHLTAA